MDRLSVWFEVYRTVWLYLNNVELKTEAQPCRNLSILTGQPVHLATLIDGAAVYIDKIEKYNIY